MTTRLLRQLEQDLSLKGGGNMPSSGTGFRAATPLRDAVLQALHTALQTRPDANLHVLYNPGHTDPLSWLGDERRKTRIVQWAGRSSYPLQACPRFITLDCRHVSPYWQTTHHGLDDPWFEDSLALAQAEYSGLHDTRRYPSGPNLCGWFLGSETADELGYRFERACIQFDKRHYRTRGVRLYDPRLAVLAWKHLPASLQSRLLGASSLWICPDALGQVAVLQASGEASEAVEYLSESQWQRIDLAGVVISFLAQWRQRQPALVPQSADMREQIYQHVLAADTAGLNGRDLAAYVFWVTRHPELQHGSVLHSAVRQALDMPGTLWDILLSHVTHSFPSAQL